jgi:hypothetical protein
MKRRALLVAIVVSLCAGCTSFRVVEAIEPPVWHPGDLQQADSLTPMLRWEPRESSDGRYDIIIYKVVNTGYADLGANEFNTRSGGILC